MRHKHAFVCRSYVCITSVNRRVSVDVQSLVLWCWALAKLFCNNKSDISCKFHFDIEYFWINLPQDCGWLSVWLSTWAHWMCCSQEDGCFSVPHNHKRTPLEDFTCHWFKVLPAINCFLQKWQLYTSQHSRILLWLKGAEKDLTRPNLSSVLTRPEESCID